MSLVARLANRSKDYLLFNPALEGRWLRRAKGKVSALLYHRVDAPDGHAFLARGGSPVIDPEAFRADMAFLVRSGARFFTFGELGAGAFPAPDEFGVAICFDDCFADNYTTGVDVLRSFGIRATFFQSTAMVDAQALIWEHRLYWHTRDDAHAAALAAVAATVLARAASETATGEPAVPAQRPEVPAGETGAAATPAQRLEVPAGVAAIPAQRLVELLREAVPLETCLRVLEAADRELGEASEMAEAARRIYPTAAQLRAARSLGHEIGSHGHRHCKRTGISTAAFDRELAHSRAVLEDLLGEPPRSFSYPFDSHLPGDADVVRRYFSTAATVAKRRIERGADPLWLPRFTWPGPARNAFRQRRWLLTGTI